MEQAQVDVTNIIGSLYLRIAFLEDQIKKLQEENQRLKNESTQDQ